ncbi:hypothetical protein HK405_002240, partial [Cladochytrium tenue]
MVALRHFGSQRPLIAVRSAAPTAATASLLLRSPRLLLLRTMFTVVPVPTLKDNYAYLLLTDPANKTCAAVDPAEPEKALAAARERGWTIDTVLTTHHHGDHAGGNDAIAAIVPGIAIYGGDERIGAMTVRVKDSQPFTLGTLTVVPRFTICHTSASVSYYVTGPSSPKKAVFTGDTLFVAG